MRRPRRRSILLASCAIGGLLLASADALAAGVSPLDADAAQKKQATEHFAAGKKAFDSGDFDRAVTELTASLDVVDSPNARLELARALRDSGKLAEAWTQYGRALEAATSLAPKEPRYAQTGEAASSERADVEKKLALVAIAVVGPPTGAKLSVGGRDLPRSDWAAPVVVNPGAVEVVLSDSAGAELARATVNATVGRTTALSIDAHPRPAARAREADAAESADPQENDTSDEDADTQAAPARPLVPPPAESAPRSPLRTAAYVAGGVGLAGMATFTVFGMLTTSIYGDLKSTCPRGCPPERRGEIDSGVLDQTLANVGLGVGLVGLAAGTTMFFLGAPKPASASAGAASLVVAPGYLGVRGAL